MDSQFLAIQLRNRVEYMLTVVAHRPECDIVGLSIHVTCGVVAVWALLRVLLKLPK